MAYNCNSPVLCLLNSFIFLHCFQTNFVDDPLEIYMYMFDKNIGCRQSELYHEYASYLEHIGDIEKADIIYMEGISRGAEPLNALKFEHRFVGLLMEFGKCLVTIWLLSLSMVNKPG